MSFKFLHIKTDYQTNIIVCSFTPLKTFYNSNGFTTVSRSGFIRFTDAFNYNVDDHNIVVQAGDFIEMLPETDFGIGTEQPDLFTSFEVYECVLPEFFCQPADPIPDGQSVSNNNGIHNLPALNQQSVSFFIGENRFMEQRLFVYHDECFRVELFDINGKLIAKNDCMKTQENLITHHMNLQGQILFVKVFHEGSSYITKIVYTK